jgi:hypothetical protein
MLLPRLPNFLVSSNIGLRMILQTSSRLRQRILAESLSLLSIVLFYISHGKSAAARIK